MLWQQARAGVLATQRRLGVVAPALLSPADAAALHRAALIDAFVPMNRSGQMGLMEYVGVLDELLARGPCNMLVFSCGFDSALWVDVNAHGKVSRPPVRGVPPAPPPRARAPPCMRHADLSAQPHPLVVGWFRVAAARWCPAAGRPCFWKTTWSSATW